MLFFLFELVALSLLAILELPLFPSKSYSLISLEYLKILYSFESSEIGFIIFTFLNKGLIGILGSWI